MPPGCGPVLFVLAGREVPSGLVRAPAAFSVPALSAEHSHRLLHLLRPGAAAGGDLELHWAGAGALVARSGGNPLFLEQLAALAADGIEDLVAPSASAALGARIERLGRPARRVLGCVGAWGAPVDTRELAATVGLEASNSLTAWPSWSCAGWPPDSRARTGDCASTAAARPRWRTRT